MKSTKESPVPIHAHLGPKKVDSLIKKIFKRNGTAFNPITDRRKLNLPGRVLDCVGQHLWQNSLVALE